MSSFKEAPYSNAGKSSGHLCKSFHSEIISMSFDIHVNFVEKNTIWYNFGTIKLYVKDKVFMVMSGEKEP